MKRGNEFQEKGLITTSEDAPMQISESAAKFP